MFCAYCYEHNLPNYGDLVPIVGGSQNLYVCEVTMLGVRGFTPHLIRIDSIENDTVNAIAVCCCCSVEVSVEDGQAYIDILDHKDLVKTTKEFEALALYRDETYFIAPKILDHEKHL